VEASKQSAAEKLRALAARQRESAEDDLNRNRLTNTAKRAQQASSAEQEARAAIAIADTMVSLADAIASGNATHLDRVTEKVQVELLTRLVNRAKYTEIAKTSANYGEELARRGESPTLATIDHVEFPVYSGHDCFLRHLIDGIARKPGLMRLAQKLERYHTEASRTGKSVTVPDGLVNAIVERLTAKNENLLRHWASTFVERQRLDRMGLRVPEQLRAACREFLQYRGETAAADKATELERALIGMKIGVDFFPTSPDRAKLMVEDAKIQPGETACEPQAGNGNIAVAIREAGHEPDVVELSSSLREILAAKNFNIVGSDFLDVQLKYDVFIMNPPFSSDIRQVRHAFSLLNEGGRIVSIVGEGAFTRNDSEAVAFREWLDELGADVKELPANSFMDRSLMVNTSANARVVRITR
jgi:hypothetical protein